MIVNKKLKKILDNKKLFTLLTFLFIFIATLVYLNADTQKKTYAIEGSPYIKIQSTDWEFFYIKDQNLVIGRNKNSPTQLAVFESTGSGYTQKANLYNQANGDTGEYTKCPSSLIGRSGQEEGKFQLRVPKECPSTGNPETWEIDAKEFETIEQAMADGSGSALINYLSQRNFFDEPTGCPGYSSWVGENSPGSSGGTYICPPDGKQALVDGKLCDMSDEECRTNFSESRKENLPSADAGTQDDGNDCADAGVTIGWIICPIVTPLAELTQVIDGILYDLLYVDTSTVVWDTNIKTAWQQMRNISSALIVLILIITIASQIFNFEFVSAYTVKKILPKLFIAVILIQLSFILAMIAINISNTVGFSIQALLSAPFSSLALDNTVSQAAIDQDGWIGIADVLKVFSEAPGSANAAGTGLVITAGLASLFAASSLAIFAASGVGIGGALFALASVLIPIVIAFFISFAVIVLRLGLIVALTIVMPIAIAAWILPGTSKWFTKWWELFFSLLVFFPTVIFFVTLGKILALVMATTSRSGVAAILILLGVILAYFIPYFFIFKFMKFSNGALSKLQGGLDSAGKKINDSDKVQSFRKNVKDSNALARKNRAVRNAQTPKPGETDGVVARTRAASKRFSGRLGMGAIGVSGDMKKIKNQEIEDEYAKSQQTILDQSLAGLDQKGAQELARKITQKDVGEKITLEDGSVIEVTDQLKYSAIGTLVEQKDSDGLRQAESAMSSGSGKSYWRAALRKHFQAIKQYNPDQAGKNFQDLSVEDMASMRPESWRNLRAFMAQSKDAKAKDAIRATLEELNQEGNSQIKAKIGKENKDDIAAILSNEPLRPGTQDMDYQGLRPNAPSEYRGDLYGTNSTTDSGDVVGYREKPIIQDSAPSAQSQPGSTP